jgi:hypothetical protein
MQEYINYLAFIGYISVSSVIAYPLLKAKKQLPEHGVKDMVFFNFIVLGSLPIIALLMKYPPKNPSAYVAHKYYNERKIWIWNKY